MFRHTVLFRWKPEATDDEKAQVATELAKLPSIVPSLRAFACGADAPSLSQVGAACPDHLVHTRRRPVFVPFDAATDDVATLRGRAVAAIAEWQSAEREYFERHRRDEAFGDPSPRVIVLQGIGLAYVVSKGDFGQGFLLAGSMMATYLATREKLAQETLAAKGAFDRSQPQTLSEFVEGLKKAPGIASA